MKRNFIGIVSLALLGAGCTSMSGLSGSSSYACKAPEGVSCQSVSGTYANAVQNNLPSQRSRTAESTGAMPAQPSAAPRQSLAGLPPTLAALRSAPRVLRLWLAAWEDADHDLVDQGYVYVQVDGGQWQLDHVQRQTREAYAPLKAPPRVSASSGSPAVPSSSPAASRPPLLPSQVPSLPGTRSTPMRQVPTSQESDE